MINFEFMTIENAVVQCQDHILNSDLNKNEHHEINVAQESTSKTNIIHWYANLERE